MNVYAQQVKRALKDLQGNPDVWATVVVRDTEVDDVDDSGCDHLVVIETYGTS